MRTAVDILLVSVAIGVACLYAFLKLAPRDWRGRLAVRLGKHAARAAESGACGGCGDCGPGADAEVRVPASKIPRRR